MGTTYRYISFRSPIAACCFVALWMACVGGCSDEESTIGNAGTGGSVGGGGATAGSGGIIAGTGGGTAGAGGGTAGAGGATAGSGGTIAGTGGGTAGTGGAAGTEFFDSGGVDDGGGATGGSGGTTGSGGTGGSSGTGGSDLLGATPPMGWNSWNTFACDPTEALIKGVADTFVSSGMAAVGYEYVNIDDCWMSGRDASGKLQWDTARFPSGIPALADYVHSKGLKFGIYQTPSDTTCAGKTGGAGHEQQDAQTFAEWGVDYLKYDHCRTPDMSRFVLMRDALIATGRPIFYSINPVYGPGSCVPPTCMIPVPGNPTQTVPIQEVANLWRIGFDINASWGSVMGLLDIDKNLAPYAGPGHWNDPDMLEVGRGMSADEDRAHFGMWAILAAPLLAGNDIRSMSETTKAIMTNAEVIAVDQDPLGKQGTVIATPGANLEVWSKELSGTKVRAVGLLNRTEAPASITVQWSDLGISTGAATVRDLWNKQDLGSFTGSYTANNVPRHGMVMLKVTSTP